MILQFLANYVATLACRLTKLKRTQQEIEPSLVKIDHTFRQDMLYTEGQTDRQTDTFTDNKGHLAARRSNRQTDRRTQTTGLCISFVDQFHLRTSSVASSIMAVLTLGSYGSDVITGTLVHDM